jgi:hypothetical protein
MYDSDHLLVVEEDQMGKPNVLDGFDRTTGHKVWVFSCGDGDRSDVADTTYGATSISVTCDRGTVTVNPKTGKEEG